MSKHRAMFVDDDPDYHPTRSLRQGGVDAKLRAHGFTIYSRPRDGEVIWECGAKRMTQSKALESLEKK